MPAATSRRGHTSVIRRTPSKRVPKGAGISWCMQRGTPWTGLALVALGAFIVWLPIQMALGMAGRRRGQ